MSETTVTLSREELIVILSVTELGTILGLVPEPIEGITAEQEAYGQICAERALRARGLAFITPENQLAFHKEMLPLVIACARAVKTVVISQTATASGQTRQLYLHQHQNAWVIHAKPEPVIHNLTQYEDAEELASLVMAFCGWADRQADGGEERPFTIPSPLLKQIQTQLQNEAADAAMQTLTQVTDEDNANQLARHLASPRIVTVIQQIEAAGDDSVALQSWTISDDGTTLWLFNDNEEKPELIDIQTTSYQAVLSLLHGCIS